MNTPLIEAVNVKKYFKTPRGLLHAVEDVNFKIFEGKTLGVVGESGCGKSVLINTILNLLPKNAQIKSGEIIFENQNLLNLKQSQYKNIRGKKISLIPQDPFMSLNPVYCIISQVSE